jgi:hypothetical protein
MYGNAEIEHFEALRRLVIDTDRVVTSSNVLTIDPVSTMDRTA